MKILREQFASRFAEIYFLSLREICNLNQFNFNPKEKPNLNKDFWQKVMQDKLFAGFKEPVEVIELLYQEKYPLSNYLLMNELPIKSYEKGKLRVDRFKLIEAFVDPVLKSKNHSKTKKIFFEDFLSLIAINESYPFMKDICKKYNIENPIKIFNSALRVRADDLITSYIEDDEFIDLCKKNNINLLTLFLQKLPIEKKDYKNKNIVNQTKTLIDRGFELKNSAVLSFFLKNILQFSSNFFFNQEFLKSTLKAFFDNGFNPSKKELNDIFKDKTYDFNQRSNLIIFLSFCENSEIDLELLFDIYNFNDSYHIQTDTIIFKYQKDKLSESREHRIPFCDFIDIHKIKGKIDYKEVTAKLEIGICEDDFININKDGFDEFFMTLIEMNFSLDTAIIFDNGESTSLIDFVQKYPIQCPKTERLLLNKNSENEFNL